MANAAMTQAKPTCIITEGAAWAPLWVPVGLARGSVDAEEVAMGATVAATVGLYEQYQTRYYK